MRLKDNVPHYVWVSRLLRAERDHESNFLLILQVMKQVLSTPVSNLASTLNEAMFEISKKYNST